MANIVRADPFTDLAASWQRDIDRMFRSMAEAFGSRGMTSGGGFLPAVDVVTRGDDLVFRLEVPDVDPERDVEITLEDSTLHIRGERRETQEERTDGYVRRETTFGSFERALPLPSGVKADDLTATYEKGILEILVPGGAKRATQRVRVDVRRGG